MEQKKQTLNKLYEKILFFCKKIYHWLFETKGGHILFWVLGILIILLYLTFYFFKQPIIHDEVLPSNINNLIPWEVKEDESFFKALITKPFDLNITELGQYRPRYLGFLVQFLDENIFLHLVRWIPSFGNRLPLLPIAAILTVLSIVYFIKTIWKKFPTSFAFFLSTTLLFYQNYQVTTYLRARTAKLFAVSACIFLLAYALKKLDISFKKKDMKKLWLVFPIFLLMTLDEQVLAVVGFLMVLSILISLLRKKVNLTCVLYTVSCFIYATYHLFWGRWLFEYFTGPLKEHGHTIKGSLTGIGIQRFFDSFSILFDIVPTIIFLSSIVFIGFWIYSFYRVPKKEKNLDKICISIFLFFMPIFLLMLLINANHDIYFLKSLWRSVYPLIAGILCFLSFLYVLSISKYRFNKSKMFLLLIGILVSFVYNLSHIDQYYGNYLSSNGGFMTRVADMEVTKDSIIFKRSDEEDMQFYNDSVIASMNTFFTTNDFRTAKIISGEKEERNKKYYITDQFSCYLKTMKERKLVLDAVIENYKDYNAVTIMINKYERKTIPITSDKVHVELDVRTERYRAGKIALIFHRKDGSTLDTSKEKQIQIQNLYMK